MEKLTYVWKGTREGNFKYLRIQHPRNFPNVQEYQKFVHNLIGLRSKPGFVNTYVLTSNFFEAVSEEEECLRSFVSFSLELNSYCHIYSEDIFMMPRAVILNIPRIVTTNLGFIPQSEINHIKGIMKNIAPGGLAIQKSLVDRVIKEYPRIKEIWREHGIWFIDKADRRLLTLNLWNLLASSSTQDEILLASPLSVPIAVSISSRMKELIFEISCNPKVLRELDSRKVEELVAGLIEDKGYEVQLTARTRDGGRDIIALKGKGELLADEKYLIEVKHPELEHPVSVATVRELVGVGTVEPSTGLVLVSTTRFTRDAVELAAREALRYRLSLRDYKGLMEWVEEYCKKRG